MPFINKYSACCLLGPMAEEINECGRIFSWRVRNKRHFVVTDDLKNIGDLEKDYIRSLGECNFHYLSLDDLVILGDFNISKTKITNIILPISELKFVGKKNRRFRNYLNRWSGLRIEGDYGEISEIKRMIDRWSESLGDKYFRDYSGKNLYFFKNGYEKRCERIFIYDGCELVAFGVASPVERGMCSYVVGKALADKYPGLSEFTDIKLYEKLLGKYGPFSINLGKAEKGLLSYKKKFSDAKEETGYDGTIKI